MFLTIFLFLAILFFSIQDAKKKKESLKPTQYLNYDKQHFERNFSFACEFCGHTILSKGGKCCNCGGTYDNNKEYLKKKKETNLKYIEFLTQQEELIKQEENYIEQTLRALKKNWVMKKQFYNFEIGEKPLYIPCFHFSFVCEFCGTKIEGNTQDKQVCDSCGAAYDDNLELQILEKEEKLRKAHYNEYQKLKAFEQNQNLENYKKDTWMNKHGSLIAILMLLGIILIPLLLIGILILLFPSLLL
jgi:predicted ATP-dependent serine protease